MVDLELSVFHDTGTLLSLGDLQPLLPKSQDLWRASNPEDWFQCLQEMCDRDPESEFSQGCTSENGQTVFRNFVKGYLDESSVPPQTLRLLLHSIHTLVFQARQLRTCASEHGNDSIGASGMQEALRLLERWYNIMIRAEQQDCFATRTNMTLYHLILLNVLVDFPAIERVARDDSKTNMLATQLLSCFDEIADNCCVVVEHCAHINRLIESITPQHRPSWWSMAIYRTTLIIWAVLLLSLQNAPQGSSGLSRAQLVNMDQDNTVYDSPSETIDPRIHSAANEVDGNVGELLYNSGIRPEAVELSRCNGTKVRLTQPDESLTHGIGIIKKGQETRMERGIIRKLNHLMQRWRTG